MVTDLVDPDAIDLELLIPISESSEGKVSSSHHRFQEDTLRCSD